MMVSANKSDKFRVKSDIWKIKTESKVIPNFPLKPSNTPSDITLLKDYGLGNQYREPQPRLALRNIGD